MKATSSGKRIACLEFFLTTLLGYFIGANGDLVRYQGEDATLHACKVRTTHSGFSGDGYLDFDGLGSYVEFAIDAPVSGEYYVSVRYSSFNTRPADLIVDGHAEPSGTFDFSGTQAWTTWGIETMHLALSKGNHTLKVLAVNSAGPNIDWLELESPEAPVQQPQAEPTEQPQTEAVVLEPNTYLSLDGFVSSPSGSFKVGLNSNGALVLQDYRLTTIWSANVTGGVRCYMQGDGNLVIRDNSNKAIWASHTSGNEGAKFMVKDAGIIALDLRGNIVWASEPIEDPVSKQIPIQNSQAPSFVTDEAAVLSPGDFLTGGQFVSSPSGKFRLGLSLIGDLVLHDHSSNIIWAAGITNGYRCYMQDDGNFIIRDDQLSAQWSTHTSGNNGARLVVDDRGSIAIIHGVTPIWVQGIPGGTYTTPPSTNDLEFPIRGAFYYPWYPETWSVNGETARFVPDLGFYSSSDPTVVEEHIDALEYAYVDLSIASWWGPDTNNDRARITLLMDETVSLNSHLKWTVYHEDEREEDASPQMLKKDLGYLKKWFAWHPAWAHIDRRPVIYVYNEAGCEVADRWMAASGGEWYVVLKLFRGYRDCANQPDSWHQYGPADAVVRIRDVSFSISPGFWRADIENPLLPRVSKEDFCLNVQEMVDSGDPWQLITTFNEAGEGTLIEASHHWRSDTKYGFYLDCLHTFH